MIVLRVWAWRASLVCLVFTVAGWLVTGAHPGWSRTLRPVTLTDDVTGLTYVEFQPGLQAGVDFLAAGLFIATVLGVTAWLGGRRPHPGRT
jgi:hypothetical protein